MNIDKIDMIKMFRKLTDAGLVEAKVASEWFLDAYSYSCVGDDMGMLVKFIAFIGAFTSGKLEVISDKKGTYQVVWKAPRVVDLSDIRAICD